MSFQSKLSKSAVNAAGEKWARNLKTITKRRSNIPELELDMNEILCKMPSNRDMVGRFLGLFDELKERQDRITKIFEELSKFWEKLNFPFLSKQQVSAKVDKLIKSFENYRKRHNEVFEENITHLFDTKEIENGFVGKIINSIENKLNQ